MKKSFKSLLAAVMLFSATLSANAQFSKKESNRVPDRFHMGIRAGVTVSSLVGSDADYAAGSLTFPTAGFGIDFQVAPIPIFVGVGLNYMNQGYQREYSSRYYSEIEPFDVHSIQMPITASYHINVAPNLFVNPFVGPWFSYNLNDFDADEDFDNDRFDYGLRFGCGVNFGRLYMDLGYDLGLKNWYDSSDHTAFTGIFFATIGFNWAGSR